MKRIILFLILISQFAFSQTNTTTTTVGKLKMNIPDPGAKKDSVVVWDGTTKLLKFRPVSQITGTTNLDQLVTPSGISIFSSTGTDVVLPLATATNAGLLAPGEKTKLAGIAAGATANDTDINLKNRANHTGTQAIATVTGLQTALDGKEPTITAGTISQYYRGDKTFQTLDKTAVGLGNVDNTSDVNKPISTATQTALNAKQDLSTKGVANGYAGLDASGKVPLTQINDALLGSVNYQGTYNAATNTPALPTVSTSNKGYYYVISAAGTQAGLTLNAGDWIISNGTAWGKIDNNNAVTAVNGGTGNVILTTSNITEGSNLYYTDARVNANASVAASATARHNAVTIGTANGLSLSTQQLSLGLASSTTTGALSSTDWNNFNNKQPAGSYEPAFSKNTAFNKNFGTSAGEVAQGNDSRINNGQTAFGWGNHAGLYQANNKYSVTIPVGSNNLLKVAVSHVEGQSFTIKYKANSNASVESGEILVNTQYYKADTQINVSRSTYNQRVFEVIVAGTSEGGESSIYIRFLNDQSISFSYTLSVSELNYTVINILQPNQTFPFQKRLVLEKNIINRLNYPLIVDETITASPAITANQVVVKSQLDAYLPLSGGTLSGSLTAPAFFQSSDRRLKTILKREGDVAYFKWKDKRDTKTHIGYIAQEMQKKFPDQVQKDEKGLLSVNYIEVLVAKVQALEKRIQELEQKK